LNDHIFDVERRKLIIQPVLSKPIQIQRWKRKIYPFSGVKDNTILEAFDISMMLINNPLEAAKLRRRQILSIEATREYESVKSIFSR